MNETKLAAASALQTSKAALDEYRRLTALGEDLKTHLAAAETAETEASAERARADAQAVLDVASAKPRWLQQADDASARVIAAQRDQERLKGAIEHLPAMLTEAADKILAARATLSDVVTTARMDARQAYHAELVALAGSAAKVKARGYALAAGGVSLDRVLQGLQIPNAIGTEYEALVQGPLARLGGNDPVRLDQVWRDDPGAKALFDEQIELTHALGDLQRSVRTIEDARTREFAAAQRAGMAHSFTNPPPQAAAPREAPVYPPRTYFPTPSWGETYARPTVQEAAVKLDVTGDEPEPIGRAAIGSMQDQAAAAAGFQPNHEARSPDPGGSQDTSGRIGALDASRRDRPARESVQHKLAREAAEAVPAADASLLPAGGTIGH